MKQILNQRYVYKINSSYLQRNKWDVQMNDIQKCIKDRFIVSIGDSTGLRMIRNITNTEETKSEKVINEIKKDIKLKKKIHSNNLDEINKIRQDIKILNSNYYKATLEENICNVVFSSDKQYEIASNNGFYINGKKYVLILATTGGIKNNTVMFCTEEIHDELLKRIYNGFDKNIEMIPSKLMAYMSLVFSSSTPVKNTRKILVVKDVETKFKAPVINIKFNDKESRPDVNYIEDKEIVVNACDGCGLITPELSEQWSKDLCLDYIPTSYCVRNSWVKGMLTGAFNFKKYCKDVIKKEWVEDVWGNMHNINNIDVILNESMLKCWKGYSSIDDYLDNCEKNGYTFSVTKTSPKELENERSLNYQYLQCLNLSDDDIKNLLIKDINKIKDVLGLDYRKTILFAKGTELSDKNVWNGNSDDDLFAKSLMINPNSIDDDYIKHRVRNLISKRIKMLKTGKVDVEGNYQISIGEPVLQLESMFGLEPKGLLGKGEFYIEYWRNKNIKQVGAFRSPMSCKSNARKMNVCNNKDVVEWYGNIKNVIIFNGWDTTMMAMNGQDHDGDLDFTTCNSIVINGIYDEPAIDCEGKSGEKESNITKDVFINSIQNSFGNKVGSVTNVGSSCYDKISLFEEGTKEYAELDKRIKCIQFYQQECIDSAKNGVPPKPIPSHWNDFRSENVKINIDDDTGEILDSEEECTIKNYNYKLLADKKPYYFIYIYDDTMMEYNNFIKKTNISCIRRFRCNVEELKAKEYKTKDEEEFLLWFNKKIPVSCNPCIVNKIAWIVEDNFDKFQYTKNKEFDYTIYQSKNKDICDKSQIKEIKKILNDYKISKANQCKLTYKKDEKLIEKETRDETLKFYINEIIPNEDILLNTLIHLAYEKSIIPKWMVWLVSGNAIIRNMLINNNMNICYPIKDENGEFEYNGYKFTMSNKTIKIGGNNVD